MTFIDSQPDSLATLVTQGGSASSWGTGPSLDLSPLVQDGPKKVVLITEITVE